MRCSMASVSRIKTYLQCPRLYKFLYEDGLEDEADHLDFGTVIHSVFERIYRDYGGFIDLDSAKNIYDEEYKKNSRLVSFDFYKQGIKMLEDFLTNPKNMEYKLLYIDGKPALELEFFIDLEDPSVSYPSYEEALAACEQHDRKILRGFIDKVLVKGKDEVRVEDYKTSWVMLTYEELLNDLQLNGYNFAIRSLCPDIEHVEVALNYIRHNEIKSCYLSKNDAEATRRYIVGIIDTIRADNEAQPKIQQYCHYCIRRWECDAYKSLLEQPLVFPCLADIEQASTLWEQKEDLMAKKKTIENRIGEIEDLFKQHIDETGEDVKLDDEHIVTLSSNTRSFYPFSAVAQEVPYEDLEQIVSISNRKFEDYIKSKEGTEGLKRVEGLKIKYSVAPSLRKKKL